MSPGTIIADIAWQFRWRTWAMRYVALTTALAKGLIATGQNLHRHNLRILDKL